MTLAAGRKAHAAAITAWDQIYCNHGRRMADPDMEPLDRLRASAKFAKEWHDRALGTLADSIVSNAEALDAARKRLAKATAAPATAGEAAIDAEMRAYLRGLPDGQRLKVTQDAMESGDTAILRAVATAPAVLS